MGRSAESSLQRSIRVLARLTMYLIMTIVLRPLASIETLRLTHFGSEAFGKDRVFRYKAVSYSYISSRLPWRRNAVSSG